MLALWDAAGSGALLTLTTRFNNPAWLVFASFVCMEDASSAWWMLLPAPSNRLFLFSSCLQNVHQRLSKEEILFEVQLVRWSDWATSPSICTGSYLPSSGTALPSSLDSYCCSFPYISFPLNLERENRPNKRAVMLHQTTGLGSPVSCLQHLPAVYA